MQNNPNYNNSGYSNRRGAQPPQPRHMPYAPQGYPVPFDAQPYYYQNVMAHPNNYFPRQNAHQPMMHNYNDHFPHLGMGGGPVVEAPPTSSNGFRMNVNAAPFVPRSHAQPVFEPPRNMGRQAPLSYAMPTDFGAEYDFGFEQAEIFNTSPALVSRIQACAQSNVVMEIQVGLENMLAYADDYETWASAIRERFNDNTTTADARLLALTISSEMAISLSPGMCAMNAQYAIARLWSQLVCDNAHVLQSCIAPILQQLDEDQYDDEAIYANFIQFVGEVFEKIVMPNGSRIQVFGQCFINNVEKVIKKQLNAISSPLLKRVVQALKLTGSCLDKIPELRSSFDHVLTKLSGFANGHPQLDETLRSLIKSLIQQREANWGIGCTGSGSARAGSVCENRSMSLNEEERQFIETHLVGPLLDTDDNGEEIYDDYETFAEEVRMAQAAAKFKKMNLSPDASNSAAKST